VALHPTLLSRGTAPYCHGQLSGRALGKQEMGVAAETVYCLPSRPEALSSNTGAAQKKKKERERERKWHGE
jgi:hypothetical protein